MSNFEWISEKPDLFAVVVSPFMRSENLGYKSWSVTIRGDWFFCWSNSYGFTDYDCVLVQGKWPPLDLQKAIRENVSHFENQALNAKELVTRAEGFGVLEYPFMRLRRGVEPGSFEYEVRNNLDAKLKGALTGPLSYGYRKCPTRSQKSVKLIREFVDDVVRPLPPVRECLKLRLSYHLRDYFKERRWDMIAKVFRGRADDLRKEHWKPKKVALAATFDMRADLYERRWTRVQDAEQRHLRRQSKSQEPNFFAMVNATRKLGELELNDISK